MAQDFLSITDNFGLNLVFLMINFCLILLSIFGNIEAIWRLSWKKTTFDNFMSVLALFDVLVCIIGNGSIFYHLSQNIYDRPKLHQSIFQLLNITGVLNAIILLLIGIECKHSLKIERQPANHGKKYPKLYFLIFAVFLKQMATLANSKYQLKYDFLVCIISLSFCIINVLLFQAIYNLQRSRKSNEKTSMEMNSQQLVIDQFMVKLIHFAVAWVPFLVISKITIISELYNQPCINNTNNIYLTFAVLWVFSKGAFRLLSAIILPSTEVDKHDFN